MEIGLNNQWSQFIFQFILLSTYPQATLSQKKKGEKNKIFQSLSWCHMQIVIQELRLRIYKLEWRTFDPCHMLWPNPLLYIQLTFLYIYTFQQQNLQRLVLATQKKTILVNSNLREWNGLKTAIWYARATSSFLKYERSGHFFYLDTRTMLVKEKAISVKLAEP